jgi:hypothetical protein
MWDQLKTTSDSEETSFFGNDGNRSSIFDDEPPNNARTVFERFQERSHLRSSRVSNVSSNNNEPVGRAFL